MQPNAQSNAVSLSAETRIGGVVIPQAEMKKAVFDQIRARIFLAQNVEARRLADGSLETFKKEEIEINGHKQRVAIPKWKYPDTPEQYRAKLKASILNSLHTMRYWLDRNDMAAFVEGTTNEALGVAKG